MVGDECDLVGLAVIELDGVELSGARWSWCCHSDIGVLDVSARCACAQQCRTGVDKASMASRALSHGHVDGRHWHLHKMPMFIYHGSCRGSWLFRRQEVNRIRLVTTSRKEVVLWGLLPSCGCASGLPAWQVLRCSWWSLSYVMPVLRHRWLGGLGTYCCALQACRVQELVVCLYMARPWLGQHSQRMLCLVVSLGGGDDNGGDSGPGLVTCRAVCARLVVGQCF